MSTERDLPDHTVFIPGDGPIYNKCLACGHRWYSKTENPCPKCAECDCESGCPDCGPLLTGMPDDAWKAEMA